MIWNNNGECFIILMWQNISFYCQLIISTLAIGEVIKFFLESRWNFCRLFDQANEMHTYYRANMYAYARLVILLTSYWKTKLIVVVLGVFTTKKIECNCNFNASKIVSEEKNLLNPKRKQTDFDTVVISVTVTINRLQPEKIALLRTNLTILFEYGWINSTLDWFLPFLQLKQTNRGRRHLFCDHVHPPSN